MRLYISTITCHDDKPTTYEFTKFIDGASHWDMRESAERAQDMILNGSGGITVKAPEGRCDCARVFALSRGRRADSQFPVSTRFRAARAVMSEIGG